MLQLTKDINSFVAKWSRFVPRSFPCENTEVYDEATGDYKECDGRMLLTATLVHNPSLPPDEMEEVKYWVCSTCHQMQECDEEELDFTTATND